MAHPANNFTGLSIPDVGDPNDTASASVSGGATNGLDSLDNHTHEQGNGAPVPVTVLAMTAPLSGTQDGRGNLLPSQPILALAHVQFEAVAVGTVANRSVFLDAADDRLKWKDSTGTVRTFDTTPPQP